jgi:hypothetical protein
MTCSIELGGAEVGRRFTSASENIAASKVEFGVPRRRRWFGVDGRRRGPQRTTAI